MKSRTSIRTRLYTIDVSVANGKVRGPGTNSNEHATGNRRKIPDRTTAIPIFRDRVSGLVYRLEMDGRILEPTRYQHVIDDDEWVTLGPSLGYNTPFRSPESWS